MSVVLRVQRQLDLSSRLQPEAKKRIKDHLGKVLADLQKADAVAEPYVPPVRKNKKRGKAA